MANIVEVTNKDMEFNDNVNVKLPKDIKLETANNQIIKQSAISLKSYKKEYFANPEAKDPYRNKVVSAPFQRDSQKFTNVEDYFKYLKSNCGYKDA